MTTTEIILTFAALWLLGSFCLATRAIRADWLTYVMLVAWPFAPVGWVLSLVRWLGRRLRRRGILL